MKLNNFLNSTQSQLIQDLDAVKEAKTALASATTSEEEDACRQALQHTLWVLDQGFLVAHQQIQALMTKV